MICSALSLVAVVDRRINVRCLFVVEQCAPRACMPLSALLAIFAETQFFSCVEFGIC